MGLKVGRETKRAAFLHPFPFCAAMADDASSSGWEVVEAEDMEALATQTAQIEDADLHASDSDAINADPHELEHVALSAAEGFDAGKLG